MNIDSAIDACVKCGSGVYDNRADKKNPKGPDFKCKSRSCGEGYWLAKGRGHAPVKTTAPAQAEWERDQAASEQRFADTVNEPTTDTDLTKLYDRCFAHALDLAANAVKVCGRDTVITLEGVSAIAATLFISQKGGSNGHAR